MKKAISILLLLPLFTTAQNTFRAIVKNKKENKALEGTTVLIKGSTKTTLVFRMGYHL